MYKIWRFFLLFVGSTALTGLSPLAPATVSSALLAGVYQLWQPDFLSLAGLCLGILVVSVPLASFMERAYGHDPSCCTVDEAAGYTLSLVLMGRSLGDPGSTAVIWGGFFFFRLFDILKPWPARGFERLPRGWGIVADDLMAGVYTAAALHAGVLLSGFLI